MHLKILVCFSMVMAIQATKYDVELYEFNNQYQLYEEWEDYKMDYSKEYNEDEDDERMALFALSCETITKHNKRYLLGEETYTMGLNEFADWTEKELDYLTGNKINTQNDTDEDAINYTPLPFEVHLPNSINWVTLGAVTPVKNQLSCSASYAFAAVGAVESYNKIVNGRLIRLSEQNVIDCSQTRGCDGGSTVGAYKYMAIGIDTQKSYPFIGVSSECKFSPKYSIGQVKLHSKLDVSEDVLQEVLGTQGPAAVVVDANMDYWRAYKEGVYNNPNCSTTTLNHALLVVGYGHDDDSGDYWLAKNSWGPNWGERGYIRIARNMSNLCGIASRATFPLL